MTGGNIVATTSWSSVVSKKIYVFVWRLRLGIIPVRSVLDRKALDLETVLCSRCCTMTETIDHAMVWCSDVKNLWIVTGRWWKKNW